MDHWTEAVKDPVAEWLCPNCKRTWKDKYSIVTLPVVNVIHNKQL